MYRHSAVKLALAVEAVQDPRVPSEYSMITEGERLAGYRAKGDNGVPAEYSMVQFTSN